MAGQIVEKGDRWVLPIADARISDISIDYAVVIEFDNNASLRIESPFVVVEPSGHERLFVPEEPALDLDIVRNLGGREVISGSAFKDGALELKLSGSTSIGVPAGEDFEPWEFVDADGVRLVSVPGGELAVWRSD